MKIIIRWDIFLEKVGTQEKNNPKTQKDFGLRQRMRSIKWNLQFLCLQKPHPLFMSKKNVSCYWESVCLAWKTCFFGRCFTFEWRQRAKMLSYIGRKDHKLVKLEQLNWNPLGEREGFPLPLEASGAFWIRLVSFFGGKNPGQVMFEAHIYVCCEGCEHGQGTGTEGSRLESGAIVGLMAQAESTSGLHIWCCARLSACRHCAISASMH